MVLLALFAAVAPICACAHTKPPEEPEPVAETAPSPEPPPPPATPPPSLYDRLGKKDALQGIVDELLGNVLADHRIARLFEKSRRNKDRAKQLETRLVAELCVVSGGGDDCSYDGKSMKDAHKGMNVTEAQWNAFVEDLSIALKTRSVDDADAKELLGKLDEMKGDIVAGKAK